MENTYTIKVSTARVEESVSGEIREDTCYLVDVNLSQSVDTGNLNRELVAETIQKMLYNKTAVAPEDLDDSNEDYFLFSRIEDEGGSHTPDANDGLFVTYFIDVLQKVRVCNIQE